MTAIAIEIAQIISRGPLARRITVKDGMVGSWTVDAVLDALTELAGDRIIGGFDGEDAIDTGNGRIEVYHAAAWELAAVEQAELEAADIEHAAFLAAA